jgi:hypothetical protein
MTNERSRPVPSTTVDGCDPGGECSEPTMEQGRRSERVGKKMKRLAIVAALLAASPAFAWEADSTHAGLTEGAALASTLHATLVKAYGKKLGLLEGLTLPDKAVAERLGVIEPVSGLVPDARGRMSALGWLVAGAVAEDLPAERARNHFHDPVHNRGLSGGGAGLGTRISARLSGEHARVSGMSAVAWITHKDNDLTVAKFWDALEGASTAASAAEREAHLARALLTAGALVHVLSDLGSPSRARDDFSEHLQSLGGGSADRGSRFERIAALVYGRIGVPTPAPAVTRAHLVDFFTAADPKAPGLSDWAAASWYTRGTLPDEVSVPSVARGADLAAAAAATQRFPSPRPADLQLGQAGQENVALRDARGVCQAVYHVQAERLVWSIPDACAGEQLAAILPVVGAYATGLVDFLFRGTLTVSDEGGQLTVRSAGVKLGKGTLRLYTDSKGVRSPAGDVTMGGDPSADVLGTAALPAGADHVVAVFKGVDAAGEELVAVGEWIAPAIPASAPTPAPVVPVPTPPAPK